MLGIPQVQQHYERALALAPRIDDTTEQGVVKEVAALIHNHADLLVQLGDIPRALDLWNQSLELKEKIGDVRGKAATLHNKAQVIAQQGDIPRALDLWNQSLELQEKIGDVRGKAATLAYMAWAAGRENDHPRAAKLNRQAIEALVKISAWPDLVTVMDNQADYVAEAESRALVAQALWLTLRVGVPLEKALNLCAELLQKTGGPEAPPCPPSRCRRPVHPPRPRRGPSPPRRVAGPGRRPPHHRHSGPGGRRGGGPRLAGGAQGLLDPARTLPELDRLLRSWVGEWVFDPGQFPPLDPQASPAFAFTPPKKRPKVEGDLCPLGGGPEEWRTQGLRPLTIRYFSGHKEVRLWTRNRLPSPAPEAPDGDELLALLLGSVSLKAEEKARVIDSADQLTLEQLTGLHQTLSEERDKFSELDPSHFTQMDAMQDEALLDWLESEGEAAAG